IHHILQHIDHLVARVARDAEGAEHDLAISRVEAVEQRDGGERVVGEAVGVRDRAGDVHGDGARDGLDRRPHREVVGDVEVGGAEELGHRRVADRGGDAVVVALLRVVRHLVGAHEVGAVGPADLDEVVRPVGGVDAAPVVDVVHDVLDALVGGDVRRVVEVVDDAIFDEAAVEEDDVVLRQLVGVVEEPGD
ncbi:MAG: hypothetical protein ACK56I_25470, partial [bacterium]